MCAAYTARQSRPIREELSINDPESFKDWVNDRRPERLNPYQIPDIFSKSTPLVVHRPTDWVDIIAANRQGEWEIRSAKWWLIMQTCDNGWEPNQKLASFNSKISKVLNPGRTAHNIKPRSFRVLVPAEGWLEWHNKQPHYFAHADSAPVLFGGMAKAYPVKDGDFILSTSIITLPGHPKTQHIHDKSLPLIIQPADYGRWLDRSIPHSAFTDLARPRIWSPLTIQPVRDAKQLDPVGDAQFVSEDAA